MNLQVQNSMVSLWCSGKLISPLNVSTDNVFLIQIICLFICLITNMRFFSSVIDTFHLHITKIKNAIVF